MVYDCWRGMVGIIKPNQGSGSLVELIKMLADRIGVIPLVNNVRHGGNYWAQTPTSRLPDFDIPVLVSRLRRRA